MKALILAAGMGKRLKGITLDLPKCLIPVQGKPLLEYQLESLAANGFDEIIIVVGYQAGKIKGFISAQEKFKNLKVTFIENQDYATTNSSYSFWLARNEIKNEQYIHLNSDIVFDSKLLARIISHPGGNVLLVDKKVPLDESMEQVVLKDDQIIFMDKANLPNAVGRGSGMAKLSPQAVSLMLAKADGHIKSGDRNQHCHGLMRYALQNVAFYALEPENSFFKEINTEEELRLAEEAMKVWPSKELSLGKNFLVIMFGYPACGKTHTSKSLLDYCSQFNKTVLLSTFSIREELGLIDLRSSEERELVYQKIISRAKFLMKKNNKNIILDGNFNKFARRKLLYSVALEFGYQVFVLNCNVSSEALISKRMEARKLKPKSLEHAASTIDLYYMIKEESDRLDLDLGEKIRPNIINVNTEMEDVFLEHDFDSSDSSNSQVIISGIKHGFSQKKKE